MKRRFVLTTIHPHWVELGLDPKQVIKCSSIKTLVDCIFGAAVDDVKTELVVAGESLTYDESFDIMEAWKFAKDRDHDEGNKIKFPYPSILDRYRKPIKFEDLIEIPELA